jgi:hypothetical protein
LKQGLLTTSNILSLSGSIIGYDSINAGPLNTDVNSFLKVSGGYVGMTSFNYLLEVSSSVYAYTNSLMYKTIYAGLGLGYGTYSGQNTYYFPYFLMCLNGTGSSGRVHSYSV